MSKNLTPELLESIMAKVSEQLSEAIRQVMGNFTAVLADLVDRKLADVVSRLDTMEARSLHQFTDTGAVINNTHVEPNLEIAAEIASRTVIEMEREKEQIKARSCNVVVSGLALDFNGDVRNCVESFCEQHLTIKPRILGIRRLGQNNRSPNAKLCITLDSPEVVGDLLQSSTLLRKSSDPAAQNVYFNRDLTKKQADAAYKRRCLRRSKQVTECNDDADACKSNPSAAGGLSSEDCCGGSWDSDIGITSGIGSANLRSARRRDAKPSQKGNTGNSGKPCDANNDKLQPAGPGPDMRQSSLNPAATSFPAD